ncbi:MAG: glycerol dehydratase reactivase beta/small subunit family protein [Syntrophobacteraceae bacterium]|nr:glycerol dehydratase reactivase beta/small subunit family protein [Syntrophobacteraceae bacterium]
MAEKSPPTIDQIKPAVSILIVQPVPVETVECILWGFEEEGIPYEIVETESGAAERIAKQAADRSRLNVGIGLSGREKKAVLHHRDLPEQKPLFTLGITSAQRRSALRTLGANAARLVKGEPLDLNEGGTVESEDRQAAQPPDDLDDLATIIANVLIDSLKGRGNPWNRKAWD